MSERLEKIIKIFNLILIAFIGYFIIKNDFPNTLWILVAVPVMIGVFLLELQKYHKSSLFYSKSARILRVYLYIDFVIFIMILVFAQPPLIYIPSIGESITIDFLFWQKTYNPALLSQIDRIVNSLAYQILALYIPVVLLAVDFFRDLIKGIHEKIQNTNIFEE